MKILSTLINLSYIIYSVKGYVHRSNPNVLVKKDEPIPIDPNIYLNVFNPAVDDEVPTWSNKKSHTIKYYSWLKNPDITCPDYDIDSLTVLAKKGNSEIEICNIELEYGELNCELESDILDNGMWEISIYPKDKKSWIMNSFSLNISDNDVSEEFLIPTTSHYVGKGVPMYITSPIVGEQIEKFKLNDEIEIKWKAFNIDGYSSKLSDEKVTVKVAKYQPPIRFMENRLKWVTVCEDEQVSFDESSCKIDASKDLNNKEGYYWVRIYEGKEAVSQTYIQLVNTQSDSQKLNVESEDGVMIHIIEPVIDKNGDFENWNIHSSGKKEVKWKVISGNEKTEVDVYAVLLNKNGSTDEKHRICSEVEISAESCAFSINKLSIGTWRINIENVKTGNEYEKSYVKVSNESESKPKETTSNNEEEEDVKEKEIQYIPGEKSPYSIALSDIQSKWDIKNEVTLNWIPTSANAYAGDYPKLSVFAQQGKKNITLCENVEIADKTCTVKADTIEEEGKYIIVWMKDGLIINEKTIYTLDSDKATNSNTGGRMLMENLDGNKNKFYVSYSSISDEGYAQWKKDSTQKVSGINKETPNVTISKASSEVDEVYNVVCEYKDNEECIFKIPDGVKRGEVNSHWVVETLTTKGVVASRLPIRLIE